MGVASVSFHFAISFLDLLAPHVRTRLGVGLKKYKD